MDERLSPGPGQETTPGFVGLTNGHRAFVIDGNSPLVEIRLELALRSRLVQPLGAGSTYRAHLRVTVALLPLAPRAGALGTAALGAYGPGMGLGLGPPPHP